MRDESILLDILSFMTGTEIASISSFALQYVSWEFP